MAKYNVIYGCGHTVVEQLFGSNKERDIKINAAKNRICTECWKAEQAAKTKEVEMAYELPALIGSEKQVTWATTIRAKRIEELEAVIAKDVPEIRAKFKPIIAAFYNQAAAKYWIDSRESHVKALFREFFKNYEEAN